MQEKQQSVRFHTPRHRWPSLCLQTRLRCIQTSHLGSLLLSHMASLVRMKQEEKGLRVWQLIMTSWTPFLTERAVLHGLDILTLPAGPLTYLVPQKKKKKKGHTGVFKNYTPPPPPPPPRRLPGKPVICYTDWVFRHSMNISSRHAVVESK